MKTLIEKRLYMKWIYTIYNTMIDDERYSETGMDLIEKIECITFLIHYKFSLENKRLVNTKIYVNNNDVFIEYLSDVLRTSELLKFNIQRVSIFKRKKYNKFKVLLEEYRTMSLRDLEYKVRSARMNDDLSNRYFKINIKPNYRFRNFARYRYNLQVKSNIPMKMFYIHNYLCKLFVIFGPFIVTFIVTDDEGNYNELATHVTDERIGYVLLYVLISHIIFRILTIRWYRPTEFEKNSDFEYFEYGEL